MEEYADSGISWIENTPGASTVVVSAATDGASFTTVSVNDPIPGLTGGDSLFNVQLTLKVVLTASGNDIPAINGLLAWVESNTLAITPPIVDTKNFYKFGYVKWLNGNNQGLSMEVKEWDNTTRTLTLFLPMSNSILVDDRFEITPGCNRSLFTCLNTYDNVDNFRGEPFIPGQDTLLRIVSEGTPPALTEQANNYAKEEAKLDVNDP